MPFTSSHPAAILPLIPRRGRLAVAGMGSALAVGSVAPDLPFFLAMDWHRETTHTLASVLWFSLPAGLAAWLVLQHLLKAPALFVLPRAFRARIDPAPARLRLLPVAVGIALGALTHVVWDAFTHETGAAVHGIPALQRVVADVSGVRLWTYRVLQHGSTLAGALALALWIRAWLRRTPPRSDPAPLALPVGWRGPLRGALSLTPLAVGLGVGFELGPPRVEARAFAWFLGHVAVASISSAVLLLAGLGLMARLRRAQPGA